MAHLAKIDIYGRFKMITVKERTDSGGLHSYAITPDKTVSEDLISTYSILDSADITDATAQIKEIADSEWTDHLIQDYKDSLNEND